MALVDGKLFMMNTSNVHEMKFGRPQTVLVEGEARPNGIIVELGATKEGKTLATRELDHVHGITEGATDTVVGKFIVVAPEINVQQYRTIDGQIGKFVLEVGETYTAYMLSKLDRLEYSDAYFVAVPSVGDKVKVQAKDAKTGARFVVDNAAGCLRVVSVVPLWLPVMLAPNTALLGGQGEGNLAKLMPQSCQMIKVEVEK